MFSTGPMFVTAQFSTFPHKEQLAVLPVELYGKYTVTPAAFFRHLHGSTWHGSDGKYILWIDHHSLLFSCAVGFVAVSAALGLVAWVHLRRAAQLPLLPTHLSTQQHPLDGGGAASAAHEVAKGDREEGAPRCVGRCSGTRGWRWKK